MNSGLCSVPSAVWLWYKWGKEEDSQKDKQSWGNRTVWMYSATFSWCGLKKKSCYRLSICFCTHSLLSSSNRLFINAGMCVCERESVCVCERERKRGRERVDMEVRNELKKKRLHVSLIWDLISVQMKNKKARPRFIKNMFIVPKFILLNVNKHTN